MDKTLNNPGIPRKSGSLLSGEGRPDAPDLRGVEKFPDVVQSSPLCAVVGAMKKMNRMVNKSLLDALKRNAAGFPFVLSFHSDRTRPDARDLFLENLLKDFLGLDLGADALDNQGRLSSSLDFMSDPGSSLCWQASLSCDGFYIGLEVRALLKSPPFFGLQLTRGVLGEIQSGRCLLASCSFGLFDVHQGGSIAC